MLNQDTNTQYTTQDHRKFWMVKEKINKNKEKHNVKCTIQLAYNCKGTSVVH